MLLLFLKPSAIELSLSLCKITKCTFNFQKKKKTTENKFSVIAKP